jgi:predicted nucleotidyltransferase
MDEFHILTEKQKRGIIKRTSEFLRGKQEIIFAYIFGSFLGKNISFRDIDIGIFLEPLNISHKQSFDYETQMSNHLSKFTSLPADYFDIKVLNFTPLSFQANVFSRGQLLFSKNDSLLTRMIEEASLEAVINYEFIKQSLSELLS